MGTDQRYLLFGAVVVLVFVVGMVVTHPSLRPPIGEMRVWLVDLREH